MVPEILPHIAFVALFSVVVAALSHYQLIDLTSLTIMPVTLLGIVLSILLLRQLNVGDEHVFRIEHYLLASAG